MKLVTFEIKTPVGDLTRIGDFSSDRIIDLNFAYIYYLHNKKSEEDVYSIANSTIPLDMITFLKFGSPAKEAAEKAVEFVNSRIRKGEELKGPNDEKITFKREEVKLLAPIPRPNTLKDYMGFLTHIHSGLKRRGKEVPKIFFEIPIYHKCNPNVVAGPDDPILWPSYTKKLDYELEFGMYIGKKGVDISKKKAKDYIAGYTLFNDISARDRQMSEMEVGMGPAKGKDFNNGYITGPCLVTADELHPRINNLKLIARINGEVVSEGNTGDMAWTWEEIIEYCSQDETIYPGELWGSGTVGGGCAAENGKWIKPGDIVEMEMEGIGIIRNEVVKVKDTKLWRGKY